DGNPTKDFGPGFGQGEGIVEQPTEVSGTGSDDDFTYHFDEDTMEAASRLAPDPVDSSALRPTTSPPTKPTKGPLEGLSRPPRKSTVEDDYDDTVVEDTARRPSTAKPSHIITTESPQPVKVTTPGRTRATLPPKTVEHLGLPDLNPVTDAEIEHHGAAETAVDPVVGEAEPPEPDFGPGFEGYRGDADAGPSWQDHGEDGVAEDVDERREGLLEPDHGEDGVVEDVDEGEEGPPWQNHGEDGVVEDVDEGREGLLEPDHGEDGVVED
ncbi:26S proteasome non-ATPase regulatory subunit 8, partial [Perkinsus olseni]